MLKVGLETGGVCRNKLRTVGPSDRILTILKNRLAYSHRLHVY
jgi:hypothetical protein